MGNLRTIAQKLIWLPYLLVGVIPLLLFGGCVVTTDPGGTLNLRVVLVNDSDFVVEDYAGFGWIGPGGSKVITAQLLYYGDLRTAKNCCRDSYFLRSLIFAPDNPGFNSAKVLREGGADIKFDQSHCIYFEPDEGHYNIANYEIIDIRTHHVQLTYRIINEVFLQVEACRNVREL